MKMGNMLFSTPMVHAILREKNPKTQTRRVMKPTVNGGNKPFRELFIAEINVNYKGRCVNFYDESGYYSGAAQFKYQVGQIVYVKEKYYTYGKWTKNGTTKTGKQKCKFVGDFKKPVYYFDTIPDDLAVCKRKDEIGYFCRPSIFMPREAARIFLRITDIKCKRLQSISEADAIAEGFNGVQCNCSRIACTDCMNTGWLEPPTVSFMSTWDKLNAKRDNGAYTWERNPYVWIYSFKRCDKQESEG